LLINTTLHTVGKHFFFKYIYGSLSLKALHFSEAGSTSC